MSKNTTPSHFFVWIRRWRIKGRRNHDRQDDNLSPFIRHWTVQADICYLSFHAISCLKACDVAVWFIKIMRTRFSMFSSINDSKSPLRFSMTFRIILLNRSIPYFEDSHVVSSNASCNTASWWTAIQADCNSNLVKFRYVLINISLFYTRTHNIFQFFSQEHRHPVCGR